jgi:hypothetical protein
LKDAENAVRGSKDPASTVICKTMIACTRALCCELSALRQVADSIETDLSEIDLKMPDQT